MGEYQLGSLNDYFGNTDTSYNLINPDTGSSLTSEYNDWSNALLSGNNSSNSFNWGDLLSSGSSALGKTLGSLLGLMNKDKYQKDYLEYLKDAKKKELLADLVRSKLTGQKSEKSTSRHAGFGPTASAPSLGSGRSNVTYPYPKPSNFQSKLVSYLLGGLKG